MRNNFPLASALALCGLLASCDDGRYLVGILGQGKNGPMGGSGAGGMSAGAGGAGGMSAGAGGAGGISTPPALGHCAQRPGPQLVHPIRISTAQVAERLARLMFDDRPDANLLARTATLQTSADVQTLARELRREPGSGQGLMTLTEHWLRLDEVRTTVGAPSVRGELTVELHNSMQLETRTFIEHLFFRGDGLLRTLLTAPYTFLDQRLAQHYGITGTVSPGSVVMLNPQQRSGVLTHAGLLTAHPRATSRGQWIRAALLCQPVPPPPADITQPDLDVPVPMQTSRDRLQASTDQPVCTGCHQLMDPPGFAFEHYDPLGRWRETENGVPVSSGGYISNLPHGGGYMFGGAPDLGQALAGDCSVQVCAVETFLQRGLGGPLRMGDDESVRALWAAFAAADFDLRELLVAVTGSEAFLSP